MKWSEERLARLRELAQQGVTTAEAGRILGVSKTGLQGVAKRHGISWKFSNARAPDLTPEQIAEAKRIWREIRATKKCRIVAGIMGVREVQVKRIFYPEQVRLSNAKRRADVMGRNLKIHRVFAPVPPPEVLAERARAFAEYQELTREYFGDPPPGRSALDRKQMGARA